ncbi:phospholipase A2 [Streptomyces platensis]|uniref:phospholipase A2 n=2 Tax=Streptomyces platensis TaxID=58346 RepID=UPI002ECFC7E5|nr:phospholipase A2 [Streptomyces platensis]WTI56781.1 phospholipase A2 [Streptomyces platensis]
MTPDPDADGRTPSAPKTRANAVSKNSPEIRGGIHSAKPQSLRRRILRRPTTGRTGAVVAGVLTAVFLSALPAAAEPSVGSSPVVLSRIVGAPEDHLYGLAADHSAVYEQTGSNTHWEKIGGPASDLYAGGAGLFATRPDTGALYKYDGTPEAWSEIGDPGADFAVTGDHLYSLTTDRSAVYEWTGSGTAWNKVGGPASDLYAGGAGLFATRPDTGALYKYNGTPEAWSEIGNAGTDFAVTGDHLYSLTTDRSAVYEWTGSGTAWNKVGGPASDLYAGGAGLFATRPDTDALYKYNGTPEAWSEIGNAGTDFAVTDHHVYGLTPDRIAVFEWEGKGTEWKAKRAPIVSGETRQAKLERMKQLTEPGLPATSDWFDALSQHLQGVPDPFVFDWANDGCSKVPDTFQGFDFKNACNRHDFGYRNYQSLLGEQNFLTTSVGQEAKKRVDDIFLQDLQAECNFKMWPIDPRSDFSRQQCRRIAKGYYEGVVNLYKG